MLATSIDVFLLFKVGRCKSTWDRDVAKVAGATAGREAEGSAYEDMVPRASYVEFGQKS